MFSAPESLIITLLTLPVLVVQVVVPLATLVLAYRCYREVRALADHLRRR